MIDRIVTSLSYGYSVAQSIFMLILEGVSVVIGFGSFWVLAVGGIFLAGYVIWIIGVLICHYVKDSHSFLAGYLRARFFR